MANKQPPFLTSQQYLKFILQKCDYAFFIDEDEMEDITPQTTLAVLYPTNSKTNLQVHLIADSSVEIHMGEDHEMIGKYTAKQFLDVCDVVEIEGAKTIICDWVLMTCLA